MRTVFVTLRWLHYFLKKRKKTLKTIYFKKVFSTQLKVKTSFSFEDNFKLEIEPDSEVNILNDVHFSNSCYIKVLDGGKITIGKNTYFNSFCSINALENISIGSNCLFGEGVKLYDHNHKFNKPQALIKDQGYSCSAINIGNNVWVGSNVIILKGVTIGDNSVIGAGCIISQSIPANSIVKQNVSSQTIEAIKYETSM